MIAGTRVIVATFSLQMYKGIKQTLEKEGIEVCDKITSVLNLDNLLLKTKKNVLIVDVDQVILNYKYAKQLTEANKLLVIITASNAAAASPFIKPPINDFFIKPRNMEEGTMRGFVQLIKNKIKDFKIPVLSYMNMSKTVDTNDKIIAIASSTGGTEALEKILHNLPENVPPILVVQHMISGFTKLFADRLNSTCAINVKEASTNDYLQRGLALIAPTDYHMVLVKRNQKLMVECITGTKINGVMPAADVLFDSIAPIMKQNAIGVILTGMGSDGAKGLLKMKLAGSYNIGQDEATCTVYGMPKVAHDLGALHKQLPIERIAQEIIEHSAMR